MAKIATKERVTLFIGDVLFLIISLWVTLAIRNMELPLVSSLYDYVTPFSILFILWLIVFFITGLYEKHTTFTKSKLPRLIIIAQITNVFMAIVFFYFIAPYFGIAPKTNLLIYLIVSTILIVIWRLYIFPKFNKGQKENALIIGTGNELRELSEEIKNNDRYPFSLSGVVDCYDLNSEALLFEVKKYVQEYRVSVIVLDVRSPSIEPILPHFYELMFDGVVCIEFSKLYEEIFDRIPLSSLDHQWFIQNMSVARKAAYDTVKRAMDIVFSLIISVPLFILYPFVALAIKIEDRGPVLIIQERVGQGGKIIKIPKFRSMTGNEDGKWMAEGTLKVTCVGKFIKKSRIDELPQVFSVLKGELSLIGPRPDIKGLGIRLHKEIPYYAVRNVIKPGLSGWAQVMQGLPPQTLEETKVRLAYDFYYIKNRSLWLDFSIALKTIKTLCSRVGM